MAGFSLTSPTVSVAAPRGGRRRSSARRRGEQLLQVERLDEVVVGAGVEALDAGVDRVARGEHQDRHVAVGAQLLAHLDAVELRQPEVEDHGVGLEHAGLVERGLAVLGEPHVVALAAQGTTDDIPDIGVVFDYEHSCPIAHRIDSKGPEALRHAIF